MGIDRTLSGPIVAKSPGAAREGDGNQFAALQTIAWTAYFIVHYLGALADGEPDTIVWASLGSAVAGFVLTTLMRNLLGPIWRHSPLAAAGRALAISFVFAIPFSAISEQSYALAIGEGWRFNDPMSYLHSAFWCGSILLTWAGMYFGIQYYREAVQHREAALKAEAVAFEAQLAMLRYQLNPHFLFNTLNGISTLIGADRRTAAIDMLDRLGSLLQEALTGNPHEKVSLDTELRLVNLYLDIEKVRFSDRLRIEIDVTREARDALVPHLLLQPLVENTVRHAVAPVEYGATIHISASIVDQRLHLVVADDGPGFRQPAIDGNGIGMRNVMDRLSLLYGERHRIRVLGAEPSGVRIELELPLEFKT